MNETDMLRQVLFQQALAAVQANGNPRLKLGDEPFVLPTDGSLYVEFWFKMGKTQQIELGKRGSYECSPGICQFTLYAPEKMGDGAITRLGDAFKKAFSRAQWQVPPYGYATLEPMSVQPLGIRNGHHVVIVDGGFDFYHHDPDAS